MIFQIWGLRFEILFLSLLREIKKRNGKRLESENRYV